MNSQAENNEAGWPSNRAPALLPAETAERNIEVAREPSGKRGFLFRSTKLASCSHWAHSIVIKSTIYVVFLNNFLALLLKFWKAASEKRQIFELIYSRKKKPFFFFISRIK